MKLLGRSRRSQRDGLADRLIWQAASLLLAYPDDEHSARYVPRLRALGYKVIDKSNTYRLDPTVPLVVAGVNDGLVEKADAEALIAESRLKRLVVHPLAVVAEQKWKSLQPPHRPLDLEALGEWLAAKIELEYFHIDPLKVDFTAVTDVMSSAYATRFGILPVQVNAREIVVATTEPFLREWEKEIAGIASDSRASTSSLIRIAPS